jgi:hypothetical protein
VNRRSVTMFFPSAQPSSRRLCTKASQALGYSDVARKPIRYNRIQRANQDPQRANVGAVVVGVNVSTGIQGCTGCAVHRIHRSRTRHGLPWSMRAAIDILIIGAITVVLSLFLLGYMGSRDRNGLPWDMRNVTDDILVIAGIMVLLSLFLFRW